MLNTLYVTKIKQYPSTTFQPLAKAQVVCILFVFSSIRHDAQDINLPLTRFHQPTFVLIGQENCASAQHRPLGNVSLPIIK